MASMQELHEQRPSAGITHIKCNL